MSNRKLRPRGSSIADCRGDSGQALIELALTLPLFLLLLLGAAEFGRLAYMSIEISEAAKAAALYGSQNATTANDADVNSTPSGLTLTARKNAPYVYANCTNFTVTVPTLTNAQCICMSGGSPVSSTPTTSACSNACTGYVVQVVTVNTSATCSPVFVPRGFSSAAVTLNGSAVQEVLN
jgi:Flp pilus assembly protein TadG